MVQEQPDGAQGHCQNCQARLHGPYCHHCGQPAKPVVRFFGALVLEFLQETISLDSRAMRTLIALLARPGFLTNAYLSGRRKRFVPPLRLFLFASVVCIFAIWLLNVTGDRELVVAPGALLAQGDAETLADKAEAGAAVSPPGLESMGFTFDDGGLSVNLPWLSEADNRQLEARLEKSIAKIRSAPNDFISDVLENVPQTTLLLVPLFALLMKLAYPFSGRYYVEHLIHALHGHAFLFVTVLLLIGLDLGPSRLSAESGVVLQWLGHLLGLLETLLVLWVPVYFMLSLRAVYGQSWGATLWKGLGLGICYLFLFLVAFLGLILVSVLVS